MERIEAGSPATVIVAPGDTAVAVAVEVMAASEGGPRHGLDVTFERCTQITPLSLHRLTWSRCLPQLCTCCATAHAPPRTCALGMA